MELSHLYRDLVISVTTSVVFKLDFYLETGHGIVCEMRRKAIATYKKDYSNMHINC